LQNKINRRTRTHTNFLLLFLLPTKVLQNLGEGKEEMAELTPSWIRFLIQFLMNTNGNAGDGMVLV